MISPQREVFRLVSNILADTGQSDGTNSPNRERTGRQAAVWLIRPLSLLAPYPFGVGYRKGAKYIP